MRQARLADECRSWQASRRSLLSGGFTFRSGCEPNETIRPPRSAPTDAADFACRAPTARLRDPRGVMQATVKRSSHAGVNLAASPTPMRSMGPWFRGIQAHDWLPTASAHTPSAPRERMMPIRRPRSLLQAIPSCRPWRSVRFRQPDGQCRNRTLELHPKVSSSESVYLHHFNRSECVPVLVNSIVAPSYFQMSSQSPLR